MKTMTCKQLGGVCDEEFHAETLEEMAEMAKKHAMEMAEKGDKRYIEQMEEMKKGTNDPGAKKERMEGEQKEFDAVLENK